MRVEEIAQQPAQRGRRQRLRREVAVDVQVQARHVDAARIVARKVDEGADARADALHAAHPCRRAGPASRCRPCRPSRARRRDPGAPRWRRRASRDGCSHWSKSCSGSSGTCPAWHECLKLRAGAAFHNGPRKPAPTTQRSASRTQPGAPRRPGRAKRQPGERRLQCSHGVVRSCRPAGAPAVGLHGGRPERAQRRRSHHQVRVLRANACSQSRKAAICAGEARARSPRARRCRASRSSGNGRRPSRSASASVAVSRRARARMCTCARAVASSGANSCASIAPAARTRRHRSAAARRDPRPVRDRAAPAPPPPPPASAPAQPRRIRAARPAPASSGWRASP